MKKKLLIIISTVLSVVIVCTVVLVFLLGNKKTYEYGEEEMTTPFWLQDVMYNESVLLVRSEDGALASGNLAFVPKGKVKITNSTMEIEYKEGEDFTISGRTITVTEHLCVFCPDICSPPRR